MAPSDAELTAVLVATRDADVFGELVRRHQALVRNMLARMTGDRVLADDIAQDAFVHAFERLDQFTGRGSFRSWLCRIAYTKLLESARKRKSHRRILSALRAGVEEAARTPMAAHAGASVDVSRALERLSDAERAAVVLCYACGFSHADAAEVLKMPLGTVKSHVLRGRKKLEDALASRGADHD